MLSNSAKVHWSGRVRAGIVTYESVGDEIQQNLDGSNSCSVRWRRNLRRVLHYDWRTKLRWTVARADCNLEIEAGREQRHDGFIFETDARRLEAGGGMARMRITLGLWSVVSQLLCRRALRERMDVHASYPGGVFSVRFDLYDAR